MRIVRDDEEGKEAISQYIIRSTFSLEKMTHNKKTNTVIYQSKMTPGKNKKNFQIYTADEFIAAIKQHTCPSVLFGGFRKNRFKWSVTMVGIQTSHAEYERNRGFLNQEKCWYKNC